MVAEQIDIRGLFAELGIRDWRRVGAAGEYQASCPFKENHRYGDRHPSFGINANSGLWLCRGCGKRGNLIQLIQEVLDCDFSQARRIALEYGEEQDLLKILEQNYNSGAVRSRLRGEFDSKYINIYHPYWAHRRLDERSVARYELGFDEEENRPIVPHFWKGELVGWQKRSLDGQAPKWQSSPMFPKSTTIFGADQVQRGGLITVVEAPVSAIYLTQLGFPAVATFGASVSYDQSVEIRKRWDGTIIWFDPDEAGRRGRDRLIDLLYEYTPLWCVESPPGDPNDLEPDKVREVMTRLVQVHKIGMGYE